MDKDKIVVMDFSTQQTHVFDYDQNVWEDCIEFLESNEVKQFIPNGHTNAQWMVVEGNLNLTIH